MSKPLAFSALKAMSPKRREERIAQVATDAQRPPNGEIKAIAVQLGKYEHEFGCSSDEMRNRVSRGEMNESDDVCDWLMLLNLQSRVLSRSR